MKKLVYQGVDEETAADTVADFLRTKGVDPAHAIIELDGKIFAPGELPSGIAFEDGATLNVFRLVAGG